MLTPGSLIDVKGMVGNGKLCIIRNNGKKSRMAGSIPVPTADLGRLDAGGAGWQSGIAKLVQGEATFDVTDGGGVGGHPHAGAPGDEVFDVRVVILQHVFLGDLVLELEILVELQGLDAGIIGEGQLDLLIRGTRGYLAARLPDEVFPVPGGPGHAQQAKAVLLLVGMRDLLAKLNQLVPGGRGLGQPILGKQVFPPDQAHAIEIRRDAKIMIFDLGVIPQGFYDQILVLPAVDIVVHLQQEALVPVGVHGRRVDIEQVGSVAGGMRRDERFADFGARRDRLEFDLYFGVLRGELGVHGIQHIGARLAHIRGSIAIVPHQHLGDFRRRRRGGHLSFQLDEHRVQATLRLPTRASLPVLVIEDSLDTIRLLERYVADTRYCLVSTNDPQQAISMVESSAPRVILIDVMMPRVDGWTLLQRLRNHPLTANIPVVICSILRQEELALSLGASAYLRKPM